MIDAAFGRKGHGVTGPFRLAVIDIDDTLVGPDREIGVANYTAVGALRRHGLRVVLASGRSHANMLRFHRTLRLGRAPVISAGGAVVRGGETGEYWLERTLPPDRMIAVTRDGLARGHSVMHYRRDGIYIQARTDWTEYDQARNDEPQVLVPDLLGVGAAGVSKVLWLGDAAAIAGEAAEVTARYAGELAVTPTDPGYLEFSASDVDKATGLGVVASRLHVAPEQVIAFGDGNNDVAVLRWAGLGVAMGHARPAARAAADLVGPPGDVESSLSRAVAEVLPCLGEPLPRGHGRAAPGLPMALRRG